MKFIDKIKDYFSRKPKSKVKPYLFDSKYKVVPAFEHNGIQYYMFEDSINTLTGRGLTAMVYYEELMMRCSLSYLQAHCEAMDKLLENPKTIKIQEIIRLHIYMKERVNLLYAVPDHIWKLASIVFFDDTESPFMHDIRYGQKKIERWKEGGDNDVRDFFYSTPLKVLIPFIEFPEEGTQRYSNITNLMEEKVKSILQPLVSDDLSKVNF